MYICRGYRLEKMTNRKKKNKQTIKYNSYSKQMQGNFLYKSINQINHMFLYCFCVNDDIILKIA